MYVEMAGVKLDELLGGSEMPVEVWNVNVATDAVIERGQVLSAASMTAEFKVATSSDAGKVLVVAARDFEADAAHTVTQVYAAGMFNRERVKSEALTELEPALRTQGIWLTSIKPAP